MKKFNILLFEKPRVDSVASEQLKINSLRSPILSKCKIQLEHCLHLLNVINPIKITIENNILPNIDKTDLQNGIYLSGGLYFVNFESFKIWFEQVTNCLNTTDSPLEIKNKKNVGFIKTNETFRYLYLDSDFGFDLNQNSEDFAYTAIASRTRYVNQITWLDNKLIKRIHSKEKGINEFQFINEQNKKTLSYYPTVKNLTEMVGYVEYEIEFIKMLDMSRIYLFANWDSNDWEVFFNQIDNYIKSLDRIQVDSNMIKNIYLKLLIEKTEMRLKQLENLNFFEQLNTNFIQKYDVDFKQSWQNLKQKVLHALENLNDQFIYNIHGDLCFSNILYSRKNKELKLIDPRGGLSQSIDYLPLEYDMAKLSHSFLGHYDEIVNDVFLDSNVNLIQIDFLKQQFANLLVKNNMNYQFIRLIEATLFYSMLPLHADDQERVYQLMCAGYKSSMIDGDLN